MKLNPDCIRNILLTVENTTGYGSYMRYPSNTEYELLKSFSYEEVMYHIKQAELSGFTSKVSYFLGIGEGCLIQDLSPKGHEFVANIRLDNNWNKTKEIAKSVGSYSLDALTKIATGVITNLINSSI